MLEPKVLLIDEPSIGLALDCARARCSRPSRPLSGGGWTILLVEQNARSGLAIAQHGAVLDGGVVKHTGPGSLLLEDPEIGRLYLGVSRDVAHATATSD